MGKFRANFMQDGVNACGVDAYGESWICRSKASLTARACEGWFSVILTELHAVSCESC